MAGEFEIDGIATVTWLECANFVTHPLEGIRNLLMMTCMLFFKHVTLALKEVHQETSFGENVKCGTRCIRNSCH